MYCNTFLLEKSLKKKKISAYRFPGCSCCPSLATWNSRAASYTCLKETVTRRTRAFKRQLIVIHVP